MKPASKPPEKPSIELTRKPLGKPPRRRLPHTVTKHVNEYGDRSHVQSIRMNRQLYALKTNNFADRDQPQSH